MPTISDKISKVDNTNTIHLWKSPRTPTARRHLRAEGKCPANRDTSHAFQGLSAAARPASLATTQKHREQRRVAVSRQTDSPLDFDAIIIGAGLSGMYQLYRLRELGLRVRVFEAGTGVGGTWYWNRYPGARFDSESYSYGYSFSKELLQEWEWSEHFADQPETLRYCNYVADKFGLGRAINFRCRVAAATWEENTRSWNVALEDGRSFRARFLTTAI